MAHCRHEAEAQMRADDEIKLCIEIDGLNEQIAKLTAERDALRAKVERMRLQRDALQAQRDGALDEVTDLGEELAELRGKLAAYEDAPSVIRRLLKIIDTELFPNVGRLAIQNYQELNEAPMDARKLLREIAPQQEAATTKSEPRTTVQWLESLKDPGGEEDDDGTAE